MLKRGIMEKHYPSPHLSSERDYRVWAISDHIRVPVKVKQSHCVEWASKHWSFVSSPKVRLPLPLGMWGMWYTGRTSGLWKQDRQTAGRLWSKWPWLVLMKSPEAKWKCDDLLFPQDPTDASLTQPAERRPEPAGGFKASARPGATKSYLAPWGQ